MLAARRWRQWSKGGDVQGSLLCRNAFLKPMPPYATLPASPSETPQEEAAAHLMLPVTPPTM